MGDRLMIRPTGFLTSTTLTHPLNIVIGNRTLLRLPNGVIPRRITRRIPIGNPRRHLDILDQPSKILATTSVNHSLLMLRGRPLGMAAHRLPYLTGSDEKFAR
jgi:hypothetical protein